MQSGERVAACVVARVFRCARLLCVVFALCVCVVCGVFLVWSFLLFVNGAQVVSSRVSPAAASRTHAALCSCTRPRRQRAWGVSGGVMRRGWYGFTLRWLRAVREVPLAQRLPPCRVRTARRFPLPCRRGERERERGRRGSTGEAAGKRTRYAGEPERETDWGTQCGHTDAH